MNRLAYCNGCPLINLDSQEFMTQIQRTIRQDNEPRSSSFHAINPEVIAFSVLKMLHERHFSFRLNLRHLLTAVCSDFLATVKLYSQSLEDKGK
jgi:hypothetical protein